MQHKDNVTAATATHHEDIFKLLDLIFLPAGYWFHKICLRFAQIEHLGTRTREIHLELCSPIAVITDLKDITDSS